MQWGGGSGGRWQRMRMLRSGEWHLCQEWRSGRRLGDLGTPLASPATRQRQPSGHSGRGICSCRSGVCPPDQCRHGALVCKVSSAGMG